MAQPQRYERQHNFAADDEINKSELDAEFDRASLSINGLRAYLALIMADDGTLLPGVVKAVNLDEDVFDRFQDEMVEASAITQQYADSAARHAQIALENAEIAVEAGKKGEQILTQADAVARNTEVVLEAAELIQEIAPENGALKRVSEELDQIKTTASHANEVHVVGQDLLGFNAKYLSMGKITDPVDSVTQVNDGYIYTVAISIDSVQKTGQSIESVKTVADNIDNLNVWLSTFEGYKADAESASVEAQASSTAAASSASSAQQYAANALESKNAAAQSATESKDSEDAALASANAAQASQSAAKTSETNAATSANSAAGSATSAEASAQTATEQASEATSQATAAAGSASSASASATTATTKAQEASASASTAASKATEASNQASAAAQSATTASGHATTATTKAGEASTSATNAASSATQAAESATSAAESAQRAEDIYESIGNPLGKDQADTLYAAISHQHTVSDLPVATNEQAISGTDDATVMTPAKTKAAIQALAPEPDLSGYATKAEVNSGLSSKANVSHTHTGLDASSFASTITLGGLS